MTERDGSNHSESSDPTESARICTNTMCTCEGCTCEACTCGQNNPEQN